MKKVVILWEWKICRIFIINWLDRLPLQYMVWCGTLKRVMWYFEEGDVLLWRGWCGTLKRAVWYFEESGVVLWGVLWYFQEGGVVLWRVLWYFEEGGVLLWRGCRLAPFNDIFMWRTTNRYVMASVSIYWHGDFLDEIVPIMWEFLKNYYSVLCCEYFWIEVKWIQSFLYWS